MHLIKRLAVFPVISDGNWLFRVSISNSENIMIFAINKNSPETMMIRFFATSDMAEAWIQECKSGKHVE